MIARSAGAALVMAAMLVVSAGAQTAGPMKDRIVDAAANSFVQQIQSSSCANFAGMLKGNRNGKSRSGSLLKRNSAARERFVNHVAGPLVNKLIDCDLLPGG